MNYLRRLSGKRVAWHLLFWFTYLALNGLVVCVMEGWAIDQKLTYAMYREAFSLPVKLLLTYFIFYYVIPLYLDRTKLGKLVAMTFLSFFIATILYRLLLIPIFIYIEPRPYVIFAGRGMILTAFDLYITITSATIIKMIKLRYKSQEVEEQLIKEKLQSELRFLRAQTNPHFLFNTLNNLYVLARKKSDTTPEAIMMLSKIMRFVLYECKAPRISLSEETRVIKDYIALEKLRYNDRLRIEMTEEIDRPNTPIAPLLLLPFIENSFKHGAGGTTGEVLIRIDVKLKDNRLDFRVENTVDEDAPPFNANNGNGIGLKNVERQLDLLYGDAHRLSLTRENGVFCADLHIYLAEN